jgi:hypothetical protein
MVISNNRKKRRPDINSFSTYTFKVLGLTNQSGCLVSLAVDYCVMHIETHWNLRACCKMAKKKVESNQIPGAIMFSEQFVNTEAWIEKAYELLAAASILEVDIMRYWSVMSIENGQVIGIPDRILIQGPYFLLIAYAIENYFKTLLIHRNREALRNRLFSALPNCLKKHDLIELARDVSLTLDKVEEELLSRLGRNSIWAARYPIPTGPGTFGAMKKFSNGKSHLTAYLCPNDVSRVHGFVNRLCGTVTKEIGILHNEWGQPIADKSGSG